MPYFRILDVIIFFDWSCHSHLTYWTSFTPIAHTLKLYCIINSEAAVCHIERRGGESAPLTHSLTRHARTLPIPASQQTEDQCHSLHSSTPRTHSTSLALRGAYSVPTAQSLLLPGCGNHDPEPVAFSPDISS